MEKGIARHFSGANAAFRPCRHKAALTRLKIIAGILWETNQLHIYLQLISCLTMQRYKFRGNPASTTSEEKISLTTEKMKVIDKG